MSDPLSVTGSAVGTISLGLSLCNAIVRYARNAQGQSDDMKYLATKAFNIRSLLKSLRELIEELENDIPDVADDLESMALDLQVYLQRLSRPIQKYERAQNTPTSVRSRARRTWETAIYHFKKEELLEVRDCLQCMELDLNTALNIYSARELHKFGARQEVIGIKQDLLIEKMNTLQLSVTASSHLDISQQPKNNSTSCHESVSIQSYRPPVAYNWKNIRDKQGRKQYRFHSKWLSRAFTGTFCLSAKPDILPIVSLHCHAVVGPESWLGRMYFDQGHFGKNKIQGRTCSETLNRINNWIRLFQNAVSEGNMRPTDELSTIEVVSNSSVHVSLIDLPFISWLTKLTPDTFPALCKYINFMLDHNVTTDYRNPRSALRRLCESLIWTEEVQSLASHIIRKCGPINWVPDTWNAKKNMQSLLLRDADSIDLPSSFITVLREAEKGLRALLDSNLASQEDSLDGVTILQLAMGWPAGVKLLSRAQSASHLPDWYHNKHLIFGITDKDSKIDDYLDCCNILLETGYKISNDDITWTSSIKLANLLIHSLAKRRSKLLAIAEAHIESHELSDLRKGETGIPDTCAHALSAALTTKGLKIDHTLKFPKTVPLFCRYLFPAILDKIYEAGFIDVDLPQERGDTPLMARCHFWWPHSMQDSNAVGWLISKGADPFRRIPGLRTTVLHWINGRLAVQIHYQCESGSGFDPHVELCHFKQIDIHLFSLTTRDECSCSCSLGGCTPLSVAIRTFVDMLALSDHQITRIASGFQRFLSFLIDRNQSMLEVCHAIIRSLTFDGLNLSHTCCTELRYHYPWENIRDESDLEEIREEQILLLERFERLVSDFNTQFDALGLPLIDFLQEIWYERMVGFLSERDKYDPEHKEQTRNLGVSLEMDDIEIPFVVQLICDQIRVVESQSNDL